MVKVQFVDRQGSIALDMHITALIMKIPVAVMKAYSSPLGVGWPKVCTRFQEMRPLSVQHWCNNALNVILCWSLSSRVKIAIGWRLLLLHRIEYSS